MSEEASKPESLPGTDISPLRSLMTEFHEIYQELRAVGFTEPVATSIVAQMVSDTMVYRNSDDQYSEDFDDYDDNDDKDESDGNNERGLE